MSNLTAAALAQLATKLGLLGQTQLQECRESLTAANASPDQFLRALERKGYLTPWQSQKLLKGELTGYFLGGYRLLYKIASGSFGRVFRADDPQTGVVVAIKVLRQRWSEERRTIELFEREGKVGRSLQHPNIVSILAVDRDPASKQYYIVMEFVEGGNLRDFLAIRKKLAPAEAVRLLEDTVSGLAYASGLGVSHRDIKPTNILISAQGAAKLVDFGLAGICTAADGKADKTYRTVDYAGLEKATGVQPGDARSDIYFLGCVFFEMLTGRSPLDLPADPKARMKKQRFDKAQTLRPGEVDAPPAVFTLLNTMMAYRPQDRYQAPAQLLEAVREVRRELDGSGPPAAKATERSVFVVEKNPRLQDALRDGLKKLGYRVFLSADPTAALNRYRQKPFDALVLDSGSADEESVDRFEQIMDEAARLKRPCGGILLLAEDQADWAERVQARPQVAVLVRTKARPLTLKQVAEQLGEFVPLR
jgi:eukaryotic-like serine/threonine-protein kinase